MVNKGYIYLIKLASSIENPLYKIGMTTDWGRRVDEFQNLYGDFEVVEVYKVAQMEHTETLIHEFFEEKRNRKTYHRELFYLNAEDISTFKKVLKMLINFERRLGY